jgi:adenine deaminase
LVTDDSHPEDLLRTGHLNHLLRQAVARGSKPPETA